MRREKKRDREKDRGRNGGKDLKDGARDRHREVEGRKERGGGGGRGVETLVSYLTLGRIEAATDLMIHIK